jgi:hypothetical protein
MAWYAEPGSETATPYLQNGESYTPACRLCPHNATNHHHRYDFPAEVRFDPWAAGEDRIHAVFRESVRRKIIALSDGFPFYTHLLCLYCAELAGRVVEKNPHAQVVVAEHEYRVALSRAIRGAEGGLRDDYEAATITTKRKTDMYRHVLWGIAYSDSVETQVNEIADNIGALTGDKPTIERFSNHLGMLIKAAQRHILTRVRQGYYQFTNPLMRAYVRLILEEHQILTNGQLAFPWMRQS